MKFHVPAAVLTSLGSVNALFVNELGDFAKVVLSAALTLISTCAVKYFEYKINAWKKSKESKPSETQ